MLRRNNINGDRKKEEEVQNWTDCKQRKEKNKFDSVFTSKTGTDGNHSKVNEVNNRKEEEEEQNLFLVQVTPVKPTKAQAVKNYRHIAILENS